MPIRTHDPRPHFSCFTNIVFFSVQIPPDSCFDFQESIVYYIVVDPDPDCIRIQWCPWIRIRVPEFNTGIPALSDTVDYLLALALSYSRTPCLILGAYGTVPITRRTPTSTLSLWCLPTWSLIDLNKLDENSIWCPISTAIAEQKEDGWPELIYRWGLQRSVEKKNLKIQKNSPEFLFLFFYTWRRPGMPQTSWLSMMLNMRSGLTCFSSTERVSYARKWKITSVSSWTEQIIIGWDEFKGCCDPESWSSVFRMTENDKLIYFLLYGWF